MGYFFSDVYIFRGQKKDLFFPEVCQNLFLARNVIFFPEVQVVLPNENGEASAGHLKHSRPIVRGDGFTVFDFVPPVMTKLKSGTMTSISDGAVIYDNDECIGGGIIEKLC